jgi:uncharacterized protein (DUF1778 family)
MASKTQRIEMRTDRASEARITQAARVARTSVSAFVLDAAVAAADRMLARSDNTVMPTDMFDALIETLDTADHAPTLTRAAARPRRFARAPRP